MTTTSITGANKGLGRETARRLLAEGQDVWMAARDPERGQAAAQELGGRFVQLDVTDDDSIQSAVERSRPRVGDWTCQQRGHPGQWLQGPQRDHGRRARLA
jgi:NAD(P)-dependent dehydrogenase (short-subunit alcohol dehydrogenase family)